jgi:hypothetical protein
MTAGAQRRSLIRVGFGRRSPARAPLYVRRRLKRQLPRGRICRQNGSGLRAPLLPSPFAARFLQLHRCGRIFRRRETVQTVDSKLKNFVSSCALNGIKEKRQGRARPFCLRNYSHCRSLLSWIVATTLADQNCYVDVLAGKMADAHSSRRTDALS